MDNMWIIYGYGLVDIPSGYVKIALDNGHWNSEFPPEKWRIFPYGSSPEDNHDLGWGFTLGELWQTRFFHIDVLFHFFMRTCLFFVDSFSKDANRCGTRMEHLATLGRWSAFPHLNWLTRGYMGYWSLFWGEMEDEELLCFILYKPTKEHEVWHVVDSCYHIFLLGSH